MFIAHYENTMRNARPKFFAPVETVRTMAQIRAEKRAAWDEKVEQQRAEAEQAAQSARAVSQYRSIDIREGRTPVRSLIERVATFHGTTFDVIVGPRRDRKSVAARFDAIKAVHAARPDLSTPQIGKHFNRDHTSILHALGRLDKKR